MTDSVVGYAVCTERKPRYFAGMMRGEPVLSTKAEAENMHIFDRMSAAEVMRLLVEERTGIDAKVIEVLEGVRVDG